MRSPYAHPAYAHAMCALGAVCPVNAWGTGVRVRPVPKTMRLDAAGFHPLTAFRPDADLAAGLAELRVAGFVSMVGVCDPHDGPPPNRLAAAFDLVRPFKTHYVVNRTLGPLRYSDHHMAEVRRARRRCAIAEVPLPDHLDAWNRLYGALITRHGIPNPLPPEHIARLAAVPGLTTLAAFADGRIVAMSLWLRAGPVAYNHLGASDADGYRLSASYALYDEAICRFTEARVLNLGGNAGPHNGDDGLARFKRGFANATITAHLCGAVLDRHAYAALSAGASPTDYFPAYRAQPNGRTTAAPTA